MIILSDLFERPSSSGREIALSQRQRKKKETNQFQSNCVKLVSVPNQMNKLGASLFALQLLEPIGNPTVFFDVHPNVYLTRQALFLPFSKSRDFFLLF